MALVSRRWRARRRGAHTDRSDWLTASSYPHLGVTEVVIAWTDVMTLEEGHAWRAAPCLQCGLPPADRPVRAVVIVGAGIYSYQSQRIGTIGYLLCAEHPQPSGRELWDLSHQAEQPGCPCHSKSLALAGTYPYHQGSQGWLN